MTGRRTGPLAGLPLLGVALQCAAINAVLACTGRRARVPARVGDGKRAVRARKRTFKAASWPVTTVEVGSSIGFVLAKS